MYDAPSSTGSADVPRGRIGGALLRVARSELGVSQQTLAGQVDASVEALRGWESGRRPLTAMSSFALHKLVRRLQLMQVPTRTVHLLGRAVTADNVLAESADASASEHPLATQVADRDLTELLAWPLSGTPPRALAEAPAVPSPMSPAEQAAVASQLRTAADHTRDPDQGPLLRRQVYYLLAGHDDSRGWLREQKRTTLLPSDLREWSPQWVAARSVAVSQAVLGDPSLLHRFIDEGLRSDDAQLAHLRYWSYWVGEIPTLWTSDVEMTTTSSASWGGEHLAHSLIRNLDPVCPYVDLAVHALWSLLQHRRELARNESLRWEFSRRTEKLTDSDDVLTGDSRSRVDQLRYLIGR